MGWNQAHKAGVANAVPIGTIGTHHVISCPPTPTNLSWKLLSLLLLWPLVAHWEAFAAYAHFCYERMASGLVQEERKGLVVTELCHLCAWTGGKLGHMKVMGRPGNGMGGWGLKGLKKKTCGREGNQSYERGRKWVLSVTGMRANVED